MRSRPPAFSLFASTRPHRSAEIKPRLRAVVDRPCRSVELKPWLGVLASTGTRLTAPVNCKTSAWIVHTPVITIVHYLFAARCEQPITSMTGCSLRHLAMNGSYQEHSEEGNSSCQNVNSKY